jgi:hypothetical protein
LYRRRGPRVGGVKAGQYLIGCVLQPGIRLVQLPGCLAGQLTELVAIGHMREIPNRNALRVSPSRVACPAGTTWRRRCSREANTSRAALDFLLARLDAR